jgi:hypothetical protein
VKEILTTTFVRRFTTGDAGGNPNHAPSQIATAEGKSPFLLRVCTIETEEFKTNW